jgi:RND family efflux transporter MFP subunit
MGAILDAFRSSRWLQFGVPAALLVIVVVVVLAVSGVFAGQGSAGNATLGENQQLVSVRLDTIAADIPVNGSLVFPKKQSLTFESSGVVGDILVEVGQNVTEGQTLASLDALAVADLQTKIAQERIVVQNAQNVLNTLRVSNPVSIAQAESSFAEADVRLDDAREALGDLVAPDANIVSRAERALADARKALDDAQEELDDLINPKEIVVTDAENRVAEAKVVIDDAQEAFDDIKDGSFPVEEIRDAQNTLNFANTQRVNAQRTLSEATLEWDNRIRTARRSSSEHSENYRDIFMNYFGIALTEDELNAEDPDALLESWGIELEGLFDRNNPVYSGGTPVKDDPETRWNELRIWAWINLFPSSRALQGTCDENQPVPGNNCISRQIDDLFELYDAARDALQNTQDQAARSIQIAEDGVTAAEDAVADAQENFDEIVVDGPDASLIESLQTRLAKAQAALKDAEEHLDEVLHPDEADISQKDKNLAVARAVFEDAQEDLDEVLNPDPVKAAEREKQVKLAEANLEEARVRLESARTNHELDIELAQARVNFAQEGLNDALEDFGGAFIKAPFNGVIALVNVEMDDAVNDQSRILDIVDPSVIEVSGVIDAANAGSVQQGALARITIQSLGSTTLDGAVTFIAAEPITQSGVVSFPVRVRADVPSGVTVPVTLNAVDAVIVGETATSLLIPQSAIQNGTGGPAVQVMNGEGVIERRTVVLGGIANGDWRVVRSGLSEGDQVVAATTSLINQGNGSGGGES